MKRQFLFGSVFAAAMAVGVGAQGTGTTGQTGQATPQRSAQEQSVIATGCLLEADELSRGSARSGATGGATTGTTTGTATGTATGGTQTGATAQRSSDRDQYVLLRPAGMTAFNVRPGAGQTGQTAQTQTGQTGQTAGTTGTGAAAMGYRLVGGEEHNLKQHVNKEVEVRGTLEASSGRTGQSGYTGQTGQTTGQTGQTGQTAQAGRMGQQPNVENLPTLRITSVRQVADSCSAGNR